MSNEEQTTDQVEKDQDSVITMKQLLEAGVHFGHKSSQWNQAMKEYIYGVRNNIHIFDLRLTVPLINKALEKLHDVISKSGKVHLKSSFKSSERV